jgi:hypothetical protein
MSHTPSKNLSQQQLEALARAFKAYFEKTKGSKKC